jgi:DNA-binding winged helix-turn-helix (wHTH) protein
MNPRDQIMELPPGERLAAALHMIEEMAGKPADKRAWLMEEWKLSTTEASIFLFLNQNAGKVVYKDRLFAAVWGADPEVEIKILDVMICKLRKKCPATIATVWGVGYRLEEAFDIPTVHPVMVEKVRVEWTTEQDQDLMHMIASGSSLQSICEETGRSPRGIRDRAYAIWRGYWQNVHRMVPSS